LVYFRFTFQPGGAFIRAARPAWQIGALIAVALANRLSPTFCLRALAS
jgi:hypothetical protein